MIDIFSILFISFIIGAVVAFYVQYYLLKVRFKILEEKMIDNLKDYINKQGDEKSGRIPKKRIE